MKKTLLLVLALMTGNAHASVIINGTRVVFSHDAKEASFQLINRSPTTHLVQSWIDDGQIEASPEEIDVPFVILPPIVKIGPENGQEIKIRRVGDTHHIAKDRESVFWINVLDIPPIPDGAERVEQNYLQVALRTRIKLFYRPAGLDASEEFVGQNLSVNVAGNCLENRSPLHVSVVDMEKDNQRILEQSFMIKPFSCHAVDGVTLDHSGQYKVVWLDDYGSKKSVLL